MRHAFELGLIALVLACFWAAGCVTAALGLHLFRRIDVMLGYGYGWKDAGVQLRATRRRKDKRLTPVTEKLPYQEWLDTQQVKPVQLADPATLRDGAEREQAMLRDMGLAARVQSGAGTMIIHHAGKDSALWGVGGWDGSVPVTPGQRSDVTAQVRTEGSPPWGNEARPPVVDETMIMRPGRYGYDDATQTSMIQPVDDDPAG